MIISIEGDHHCSFAYNFPYDFCFNLVWMFSVCPVCAYSRKEFLVFQSLFCLFMVFMPCINYYSYIEHCLICNKLVLHNLLILQPWCIISDSFTPHPSHCQASVRSNSNGARLRLQHLGGMLQTLR